MHKLDDDIDPRQLPLHRKGRSPPAAAAAALEREWGIPREHIEEPERPPRLSDGNSDFNLKSKSVTNVISFQ